MQFLALLGFRPWLIIAGVAGFVLVLGSAKLDASRARADTERLDRINGELRRTVEQSAADLAAARASEAAIAQQARELAEREKRAREAVWSTGRDERLLRAEVSELKRQLASKRRVPRAQSCPCDGIGDALDVLRDRQSSTARGRAIP